MSSIIEKSPTWFWVVAIIALLWNLMGVGSFFMHTFISEEALSLLPKAERELYQSYPMWSKIIFAIAVFGGLFGCIALLLKKKWAKTAFIISLCAIIPQMVHSLFFTRSMEVYGPGQAALMPIMVVLFAVFLVWLSSHAINKDWMT